ncbi:MAG: hypothetical protein E6J20_00475 [Chloroflexi bacterium]|nr:MAG: hypothetical protein E6J20_00475 [Chloroflexota bacterium]
MAKTIEERNAYMREWRAKKLASMSPKELEAHRERECKRVSEANGKRAAVATRPAKKPVELERICRKEPLHGPMVRSTTPDGRARWRCRTCASANTKRWEAKNPKPKAAPKRRKASEQEIAKAQAEIITGRCCHCNWRETGPMGEIEAAYRTHSCPGR